MKKPRSNKAVKYSLAIFAVVLACLAPGKAQDVNLALLQPPNIEPAAPIRPVQPEILPEAPQHKFWGRENKILFASVAAGSAADFAVTYTNLSNGGRELNPMTRLFSGSTAGLAANFAGETAGVIGLSYFFHRTGHHKLERLTPLLNVAGSAFAVGYGLSHR